MAIHFQTFAIITNRLIVKCWKKNIPTKFVSKNLMAQIKDLISNGIIQDIFSNSRFCCLRCFEEAMKSYHRIESEIDVNQLFYNDDVDTTQMSGCLSLAYRHSIDIFEQ